MFASCRNSLLRVLSSVTDIYMTVHGRQQQLQSSVLMHEHLPAWGLTIEPAAEETEFVEAGMVLVGCVVCMLYV